MVGEYTWLKEKIFLYLENEIIFDNIVRVFKYRNSVIIIHIYPLQYKEPISGRGGQVLVIGYIISRELIRKYYEGAIFRINAFFNLIEQIVRIHYNYYSFDIATDFVKMINDEKCCRQEIVDIINTLVIKSNSNWNKYFWSKAQKLSMVRRKEKALILKTPEESSNLIEIYNYLRDRRFKTCIVLYNCKNYLNYIFLRKEKVELIQISDKGKQISDHGGI